MANIKKFTTCTSCGAEKCGKEYRKIAGARKDVCIVCDDAERVRKLLKKPDAELRKRDYNRARYERIRGIAAPCGPRTTWAGGAYPAGQHIENLKDRHDNTNLPTHGGPTPSTDAPNSAIHTNGGHRP